MKRRGGKKVDEPYLLVRSEKKTEPYLVRNLIRPPSHLAVKAKVLHD